MATKQLFNFLVFTKQFLKFLGSNLMSSGFGDEEIVDKTIPYAKEIYVFSLLS